MCVCKVWQFYGNINKFNHLHENSHLNKKSKNLKSLHLSVSFENSQIKNKNLSMNVRNKIFDFPKHHINSILLSEMIAKKQISSNRFQTRQTKSSSTNSFLSKSTKKSNTHRKLSFTQKIKSTPKDQKNVLQKIDTDEDKLVNKYIVWEEERQLKRKLTVYKKQLLEAQNKRVTEVSDLIKNWSVPPKGFHRISKIRLNKNNIMAIWDSHQLNKQFKINKTRVKDPSELHDNSVLNDQNKSHQIMQKNPDSKNQNNFNLKGRSFAHRISNCPFDIRPRSKTKVVGKKLQNTQIYYQQANNQVRHILSQSRLSVHDKISRLMDLRNRVINIPKDVLPVNGQINNLIKDNMLSLYSSFRI